MKKNEPKAMKHPPDVQVSYHGPIHTEFCCVPMNTITAYQELLPIFQNSSKGLLRPLYLLYGPHQFGKTTLAIRLAEEIMHDSSVEVGFVSLDPSDIAWECTFWRTIGQCLGGNATCSVDVINKINIYGKRLFLVLDDMDTMLTNVKLTRGFFSKLVSWRSAGFFHGFLGIGSHNLVMKLRELLLYGDDGFSLGNFPSLVRIQPFTVQQMVDFLDRIHVSYEFTPSVCTAIMDYSSGAPGVFGSLIRFTMDGHMCKCESNKWHSWFKIQNFTRYLLDYNGSYESIRRKLNHMRAQDWKALDYLLIHHKVTCCSAANMLDFGTLLQMGVVIQETMGEMRITSEMMRRICMEAQPVRQIDPMELGDGPLEWLCAALRWMRPNMIGKAMMENRQTPIEAIFQNELYASTRGILRKHNGTRQVLAEARGQGEQKALTIIISNGTSISYGFEIKSNHLTREEMEVAVEQADGYKRHAGIDKMFVVNFVPRGHVIDEVYHFDTVQDVRVIHIRYPETCDEYELKFLGEDGEICIQKVKCLDA